MQSFLIGNRISIHGLSDKDLADDAAYFSWLNNLELDQHVGRSRFPNNPATHRAYVEQARRNDTLVLLGIYDNATGRHIGNISLKEIDWHNRRGWLGYLIGDPEFQGKGIATDAVLMFLYYSFQKLNLNRVYTTVSKSNLASIRVLQKTGMMEEGTLRGHIILGSKTMDVLSFGALAHEWTAVHADKARKLFKSLTF